MSWWKKISWRNVEREAKRLLKKQKYNDISRRARGLRDVLISAAKSKVIERVDPKVLLMLDVLLEDYEW